MYNFPYQLCNKLPKEMILNIWRNGKCFLDLIEKYFSLLTISDIIYFQYLIPS